MMKEGKVNGYICQGFNPVASFPNKNKVIGCLSKLKFLVTIDPLNTETSNFWQNHGELNEVDSSKIQTEVFRLPSTCFAEENGSIVNSGRWLQWHWKGADAPGIALTDGEILSGIFLRLRKMYAEQGGANPDQVLNMTWNYAIPHEPSSEEVAMESNGKALADITDPATGAVIVKKGQQLSSFAQLRDDGTTSCGCWIFAGSWTPEGNQMARRDNADPSGLGNTLGWAWAWPLNRRILYNRASADPQGNPWDPKRQLLKWDGTKWTGWDIPDYSAAPPGSGVGPFIMQQEGMGRLFALDKMAEGPFPEHYEPFETPLGTNPLHPNVISNPAARIFKDDAEALGKADKFPYVGTTYRLTEHFHYWTKHALLNAILQPEQFVEIGESLANKLGIAQGDTVKVSSNRGYIKAKAVVTKRIRTLKANGKDIDTIGIPIHWGYEGVAKKGFIANTLTPFVGDANTQTPEFKSFLVNVEKV
ncbi:formate dehydrogenase-O, major subunit [Escherichia coli]|nr:formate dehydrogenase-O, major subunit [Escherichia coli]